MCFDVNCTVNHGGVYIFNQKQKELTIDQLLVFGLDRILTLRMYEMGIY